MAFLGLGLGALNSTTGFQLRARSFDRTGWSVASAGDVNGDGYADLIVGAPYSGPNRDASGRSYVVFGKASDFALDFDLVGLAPDRLDLTGFRLDGAAALDRSGWSVASAGDVNGDG